MENIASTTSEKSTSSKKNTWIIIAVILFIVIIALIIFIISLLQKSNSDTANNSNQNIQDQQSNENNQTNNNNSNSTQTIVMWSFDGNTWKAMGSAPECMDPITISSPADMSKATNILYPGQVRGSDYKPHGGIRFDGQLNDSITVQAPMSGFVWRGSRYIEAGEVQYMIDIINSCGFLYRLDHLRVLTPKFQALMETLPEAQIDDSRTYNFITQVEVEEGEEIATSVGHINTANAAFDLGIFDLRQPNEISKNPTWAAQHQNEKETAYFAQCWLDFLQEPDQSIAKSLPGGGTEGKVSDYCN
jgi:hypothetical protein